MTFTSSSAFRGRTVIVTGAGGSIGKPLAIAFGRAGADVVVNELGSNVTGEGEDPAIAEDIARQMRDEGLSAVADTHSVTEAAAIIETAISNFGRVDIVINNAGIIDNGPLEKQDPESVRKVLEINTIGAIALLHHAWPMFQKQNYGRVVNFTSDSVFGMPQSTSYVLARGAMLGVTRTLALEGVPHGITVNTVGPTSYSRMVSDLMSNLPSEQQEAMKKMYTGESNVPFVLALAHESNETTGEIFSIGGNAISRMVLGSATSITECKTMEDAQRGISQALRHDAKISEPKSIGEAMAFRATSFEILE